MNERWLSVDEIAHHPGVSKDTIYNWIKKGMPAHKIGKLWKFKASEVDEWKGLVRKTLEALDNL